jgi:hypothetical protein
MYDDLYRSYLRGQTALSELEDSLVRLYAVILQFLAKPITLFATATALRAVHAILHPDEVDDFIAHCESYERWLEANANNCERVLQRSDRTAQAKMQGLLVALREPLVRTDSRVATLVDRLAEADACVILRWVSPLPYGSHHLAAKETPTKGTAEWILQHSSFLQWRESSASTVLSLHGIR